MALTKISGGVINTNTSITAVGATFSGNVSVAGTLTYEDVTNIDSVGLITARSGIEFGTRPGLGASISDIGNAVFAGVVTATSYYGNGSNLTGIDATQIVTGNTSVQTVDTGSDGHIKFNTEGSERGRFDNSGRLLVGTTTNRNFKIGGGTYNPQTQLEGGVIQAGLIRASAPFLVLGASDTVTSGTNLGLVSFHGNDGSSFVQAALIEAYVDGTPGTNDMPGRLVFSTTADGASSTTERMRIDSVGRLGLGTPTPSALLSVFQSAEGEIVNFGTSDTSRLLRIVTGTANSISGALITLKTDSNEGEIAFGTGGGTERARIDSSGRLLVGTSSSSLTQQIESASTGGNNLGVIRYNNGSGASEVVLAHSRSDSIGTNTVLSNNDRVGDLLFRGADGTNYIDAASISAHVDGTPGTNDMPGRLVFSTTPDGASSPTERMRINSSGYIGINGTTDPNYHLTFANTSSRNAAINYNSGASDTNLDLVSLGKGTGWEGQIRFYTSVSSATASERMRITSGGSLFVATTTSTKTSDGFRVESGVPNTSRGASGSFMEFFHSGSGSRIGYIFNSGGTTTVYSTSSDYRLKENVVPLTGAVDRLNQLQVRRFNFIEDPDRTVDGFIAHEAQAVVPECVTGTQDEVEVWKEGEQLPDGVSVGDNKLDEDGNTIPVYQGIDQSKLVPLLTAALQEALVEIESLKARVTALES